MAVSHTLDAAGRETLLENRKADGTGLAIFTNTYDPVSNRLTVAELDGTLCTFGYDRSYQLTLEQRSGANAYNTSYVYDPVGNRLIKYDSGLTTNYQMNAANELVLITPPSGPTTTSTFDANGNLALQNTSGTLTTYSWDPENRLLSVSDNTGLESYSYSADGLRQFKVNGTITTNFVWDDQNLLQERDASLVKVAQYTDFPGYWGGLVSQRRSSTSSFYGFDSQSSSRILVSIGDVITDNYSYKAFGEELASGSGTVNPHQYVGLFGYYRDIAIRQYVRAREMEIIGSRWMSRDPIGYIGESTNMFWYASANPIRLIDPSGLDCQQGKDPCGFNDQDDSHHYHLCDWFASQHHFDANGADHGFVLCYKGNQIPCPSFANSQGVFNTFQVCSALPGLCSCIISHEEEHKRQCKTQRCKCQPDSQCGALGVPRNKSKQDECDAFKKSIECLQKHLNDCKPGSFEIFCHSILNNLISIACNAVQNNCKSGLPTDTKKWCDKHAGK